MAHSSNCTSPPKACAAKLVLKQASGGIRVFHAIPGETKKFAKFCSYCKAKGLPEADYTSHFVKDAPGPKGKVCCPELLKNECGYCHEIGHTPKFCPKLKARDARRKAAAKKRASSKSSLRKAKVFKPKAIKVSNPFAVLENHVAHKPEAFPVLGNPSIPSVPQGVWGASAAKAMSIAVLEKLLAEKKEAEAQRKQELLAKAKAEAEATRIAAAEARIKAMEDETRHLTVQKELLDEYVLSPKTPILSPLGGTWADECCDD